MCFFKKKQVILKRTQSIAHNKIRQKASVSLCCPPCLTLLKRKKMSTGADPLPFCAVPLWDHGMKTQRVAGVPDNPGARRAKKRHKVPNHVSPLRQSATSVHVCLSKRAATRDHAANRDESLLPCPERSILF